MNDTIRRKEMIQNLNRCLNCERLASCEEAFKEKIEDCGELFVELPTEKQVVIVSLCEVNKDE